MEIEDITADYGETKQTFALPAVGPNLYWEVGQKILEQGRKVPIGDYTAPLVHALYCDTNNQGIKERFEEVIRSKGGLYVFNRNIWTSNGVYVIQDSEVDALQQLRGNSEKVRLWDLKQLIEQGGNEIKGVRFSKDGKIRFASKDSFLVGEVDSQRVAEDGCVIANYGINGARLLSNVASKLSGSAHLHSLDIEDQFCGCRRPLDFEDRVASLSIQDNKLHIYGVRRNGSDGRGDMKSSSFGISINEGKEK